MAFQSIIIQSQLLHQLHNWRPYLCKSLSINNHHIMTRTDVVLFSVCVLGLGAPTFSDPNMLKRAFRAWPASHSIRLKCRATGAPLLHYTWLKDGMEIPRRRMDPYLNTSIWYLKLINLVPNDSGKYTCIVSNPYGSINHTYTLQVVGEFSKTKMLSILHIYIKFFGGSKKQNHNQKVP